MLAEHSCSSSHVLQTTTKRHYAHDLFKILTTITAQNSATNVKITRLLTTAFNLFSQLAFRKDVTMILTTKLQLK